MELLEDLSAELAFRMPPPHRWAALPGFSVLRHNYRVSSPTPLCLEY